MTKPKQIQTKKVTSPKAIFLKIKNTTIDWDRPKKLLGLMLLVVALVFTILITVDLINSDFLYQEEDAMFAEEISSQIIDYLDNNYIVPKTANCNVAKIQLRGEIATYIPNEDKDFSYSEKGEILVDKTSSEDVVAKIQNAETDVSIKAIILEIDSTGGNPVAAEEITEALLRAIKPTVAVIRGEGESAAYYAATGADYIFASDNSVVGGIGVTSSYLDYTKMNEKEGVTYVSLTAGKFKDMLSPDKPLTEEEKQLVTNNLNILNEKFIKTVSINRKLDVSVVRTLADGSGMLGETALKNGLVDEIGGIFEAGDYLKGEIESEVVVCD